MSHYIPIPPSTKKCPKCGRELPSNAFGLRANGRQLRAYCRECYNMLGRTKYFSPKAKHENGEVFRKEDGKLWEYTGAHWRTHWSQRMLSDLRRYYSEMTNMELASMLGVPYGTLNRKARELGLRKSNAYRRRISRQHLLLAHAETAIHGNPGQIKPGEHRGRATEFKKKQNL